MFFPKLILTDAGRALIVKALNGTAINFTKFALGDGTAPKEPRKLKALVHLVTNMRINSIELSENCAVLESTYTNSGLKSKLVAREIGIFATDPDEGEILYAYANAENEAAVVPPESGDMTMKETFHMVVTVGDATTVTATLGEYSGYASKADLKDHVDDKKNPHNVTAEQVGLGNVPNVTPANQQPVFSNGYIMKSDGSYDVQNINSGEKMGNILRKTRTAIAAFVAHLSAKNPHNISAADISAAASEHKHSADDVTTGIFPISRGGTGAATATEAREKLGIGNVDNTRDSEKKVARAEAVKWSGVEEKPDHYPGMIEVCRTVSLVGYNENTWYPVVGSTLPYRGFRNIKCSVQLGGGTRPSWSTHAQGFTAVIDLLITASGRGTTSANEVCLQNDQKHIRDEQNPPVGFEQMTNSSQPCFWLRGGAAYYLYADYECEWRVVASSYTASEQTVKPSSTYPGINIHRSKISADLDGSVNWENVNKKPDSYPNAKKSDVTDGIEDYNDSNRTIRVGYAGAGLTVESLTHIAGYTEDGTKIKDVSKAVLLEWLGITDSIYPVGSIYTSVNGTNPANLFGGTWEQISGRFLLAAGDGYSAGSTGGEANHTLTVNEMPRHSHEFYMRWGGDTNVNNYARVDKITDYGGRCYGGSTESTGNGAAHNNMPPYLVVYVWKRTA